MDLNEAMSFVIVVREGSFTAASARFGVPTSTLSRRVKRLEERLGVRLLNRTTRRLTTTEVGAAYYEQCVGGIDAIERAETIAHEAAETPRGVLRVATPTSFYEIWEALRITEFIRKYPEVRLDIREEQRPVDLVAEGFDVALRGGNLPDSSLVVRKLASSALRFYASPGYVAQNGRPETVEDLAGHPLYTFPFGRSGRLPVVGPDGPTELVAEPRLIVNSWRLLVRLGRNDLGVILCEEHAAAPYVRAGELEIVAPTWSIPGGGFFIVYPSSRLLSPKVRVFIEHVVATADSYFRL